MKFKVLFIEKKHLIYLLLIILLLIFLIIFYKQKKIMTTFSLVKDSKSIKMDFTGDGNEDILYIKTEGDKYYVQVNTREDSLYLEPSKKMNTIGHYYPYWPMKINLVDISRDKIPEIFTQASQNGNSIQHAFIWNKDKFEDILCSNNNIIGFIDYKNNKSTKFISANYKNGQMDFNYYILLSNKLKNFSYDNYEIPGKNAVLNLIKYIEGFPYSEANKPDIFYDGLTGKDLSILGKLAGEENTYIFEDGIFMDSKYNKAGQATEFKWTLNFKAIPKNTNTDPKYYSIMVLLKPCASFNNDFRIYFMALN